MKNQKFPIEVWDHMWGCCYVDNVTSRRLVKRASARVNYGNELRPGEHGETQDVLLDGKVVGFVWWSYQ